MIKEQALQKQSSHLKRQLNLPLLVLYGLGITVGAGIYVLIGLTAGTAGIFAPVSFLLAALVVGFSGWSYAELTTRYPVSAGEAEYVKQGLNSRSLSIVAGSLVILSALVSSATISIGATAYMSQIIPLPHTFLNILIVVILAIIAAWGIAESVFLAAILTLVEIGGLLYVVAYGFNHYPDLPARIPELVPDMRMDIWSGIVAGGLIAFFAFIGFEDIANVAEEVKNPSRNLPYAIFLTLIIATLLYVIVVGVVVLTVPMDALKGSPAPLTLIFKAEDPTAASILSMVAGVATLNGVLIQTIMASRVAYGMSRQHNLPEFLGRVNHVTGTPVNATIFVGLAILVFALLLPIQRLAELTSQIVLLVFILVNCALIKMKLDKKPAGSDVFSVPFVVPIIGAVTCFLLFISGFV